MNLPYCKQRWITCAQILDINTSNLQDASSDVSYQKSQFIICGDRHGSVYLYNTSCTNATEIDDKVIKK